MLKRALERDPAIVGPNELEVISFFKRSDNTFRQVTSKDYPDDPTYVKDMDPVPRLGHKKPYKGGLEEIIYTGSWLAESLPADMRDRELVEARIGAVVMLARVESGEEVELNEYEFGTNGVDVFGDDAGDEKIAELIEQVNPLMVKAGLPKGYVKASRDRYLSGALFGAAIPRAYHAEQDFVAGFFADAFGGGLPPVRSKAVFERLSKPFAGYSTTNKKGRFSTIVNTNTDLYTHNQTKMRLLAGEEDFHAINYYLWLRAIMAKAISSTYAVSTMIGPEIPQLEAAPPLVLRLMSAVDKSPAYQAEILHLQIRNFVSHRALIEINTTDKTEAEVIKKAQKNAPLVLPELIVSQVRAVRDRPVYRSGYAAYNWGLLWADKLTEKFDPVENPGPLIEAVKIIIEKPKLRSQLEAELGALL